jgi:hypothetical protein
MIYRVKNWNELYEKAQTRKCKEMKWVAVPNKLDGSGYAVIASHPRSCELFTAWILILEVASKMPTRGLLFKDGKSVGPRELARRTRFPEDIFGLAFNVLVEPEIDWLERVAGDEIIHDERYAKDRILAE